MPTFACSKSNLNSKRIHNARVIREKWLIFKTVFFALLCWGRTLSLSVIKWGTIIPFWIKLVHDDEKLKYCVHIIKAHINLIKKVTKKESFFFTLINILIRF